MITYATNWMGPVKTGYEGYCCGRIDVYGDSDYFPFNDEIGVPLIKDEHWAMLTDLLETYREEKRSLFTWDDIQNLFYANYETKIKQHEGD